MWVRATHILTCTQRGPERAGVPRGPPYGPLYMRRPWVGVGGMEAPLLKQEDTRTSQGKFLFLIVFTVDLLLAFLFLYHNMDYLGNWQQLYFI